MYRETLPNPRPSKEYDEAVENIVNEIRSGEDSNYLNLNDFIDKLFDELEKDKHGHGVEPTEIL